MKIVPYFFVLFLLIGCKKDPDTVRPTIIVNQPSVDTIKTPKKVEPVNPVPPKAPESPAPISPTIIYKPVLPDITTVKTYLALGDSYTIGESVPLADSYPHQLVKILKQQNVDVAAPKIIARTGWTTSQLQQAIAMESLSVKFDFVTLLIGVNNQYTGASKDQYREEFRELLYTAINFANGKAYLVFVLSIPDWGVTPFGKNYNKYMDISKDIDQFNAINKEETLKLGVIYIDITAESRLASKDPLLTAVDGLHPSGKMYADWVNFLAPKVLPALK